MQLVTFLVQLDPDLQALIVFGLTALVSYILLQLAAVVPWLAEYLGQYKAGIVTWLAGLIFNLLQNALNQVPQTWDTVLALVMRIIVEVAAVLLAFAALRKRGAKALQY